MRDTSVVQPVVGLDKTGRDLTVSGIDKEVVGNVNPGIMRTRAAPMINRLRLFFIMSLLSDLDISYMPQ